MTYLVIIKSLKKYILSVFNCYGNSDVTKDHNEF